MASVNMEELLAIICYSVVYYSMNSYCYFELNVRDYAIFSHVQILKLA